MFASQLAVNAMDQTTLNFGVTITYTPKGGSPVSFPVVVDQSALNVTETGAVWTAHDDLALLIRLTDYAAEPGLGDQVVMNGATYIASPTDDKYFWEWADKFQLRRRVFLKRISP
jgi:hypothetical protein